MVFMLIYKIVMLIPSFHLTFGDTAADNWMQSVGVGSGTEAC